MPLSRTYYGQIGYGNQNKIGHDEFPYEAGNVSVSGTVVQMAAGGGHTCVLLQSGNVRCWGHGAYGQLGYGNTNTIGDSELPRDKDVSIGGRAIQIAAGDQHTCALLEGGDVRGWGRGGHGRLGYANTQHIGDNESPSDVGPVPLGGPAIQIAAGDYHTCALLEGGTVRWWGSGTYGQLGYGNTNNIGDDEAPSSVEVVAVGGTVIQLAAGGGHTCALLDSGTVRCWGGAGNGQLGYANTNRIGDTNLLPSLEMVRLMAPSSRSLLVTCIRVPCSKLAASAAGGPGPMADSDR